MMRQPPQLLITMNSSAAKPLGPAARRELKGTPVRCICSELIILFVVDTGISLNGNCPKLTHNTSKNELYVVLTYVTVYTKNTQV